MATPIKRLTGRCACGAKKLAASAACKACYTKASRAGREAAVTCACGGPKDFRAQRCARCRVYSRGVHRTQKPATTTTQTEEVKVSGDAMEVTKTVARRVRTLAELVAVCEVDAAEWEVERFTCNKWDTFAIERKREDKIAVTGRPIVTELYQVKAWFKRKSGWMKTQEQLAIDLLADIRAEVRRKAPPRARRRFVDGNWLFEFTPFDLHMGKYAWSEETVTNYDVDIAEDLFNASLDYLLGQALKVTGGSIDRVLCVFGNDVSHIDSKKGETTAGTPMDADGRYAKVYRRICAIHRRAIDILRDVAPVDVKMIPGNHDELTAFHLGELLAERYDGTPHVTIDNDPKIRKYYDYGINLLGFSHGDSERVSELPLTMARERPEEWARCTEREFHIGHLHIKEEWSQHPLSNGPRKKGLEQEGFSIKGVRVRRLSSLSAHDFWHTKHAYMDRRACDSFVFHREAGFTAHLSFNVDHFTGKAISA